MPTLDIAHLREQGQDMIIVPLDDSFGHKTQHDQQATIGEIQKRAMGAGLRGRVVPVWNNGNGSMSFIAPPPWHPFFRGLNMRAVYANLNRTLSW